MSSSFGTEGEALAAPCKTNWSAKSDPANASIGSSSRRPRRATNPAAIEEGASAVNSMTGTTSTSDESAPRRKFPKHLVEIYDIEKMLGQGAFSTVWRCVHRATGQVRALKKIDTCELSPRDIAHEIALMKLLRHPNVVRCYDVFLEAQFVNIVVDMFTGGDLVDGLNAHRKAHGRIPDGQLAYIARQMVAAIVHVHSLCIVHRDVKAENFVSDRPELGDPECVIALADFGTAARLEPGSFLSEKVGTPAFWAPEVIQGKYDFLADVWAVGITVFVLLSGALPFEGEAEICRPIGDDELPFKAPWHASSGCKDFMACCLAKERSSRPQALEVARHFWMDTPNMNTVPMREAASDAMGRLNVGAQFLGGVATGICACLNDVCLDLLTSKQSHKQTNDPAQSSK